MRKAKLAGPGRAEPRNTPRRPAPGRGAGETANRLQPAARLKRGRIRQLTTEKRTVPPFDWVPKPTREVAAEPAFERPKRCGSKALRVP